jgi:hypothetical protein
MSCNKPITNKDKWIISIISALLFMLISSPYAFHLTNKIGGNTLSISGHPTMFGMILHGIIFLFIIRLLMR